MSSLSRRSLCLLVATLLSSLAVAVPCLAQSDTHMNLPAFGVQVKASTLGIGIEAATSVSRRSNVRIAFNYYNLGASKTKDGIAYDAKLNLRSLQVTYDYYLFGGVHISPGALLYSDNKVTATAAVPGGSSFTLNDTSYYSDAANPITGTGAVSLSKVAPMILLGVGNLLPRNGRRFTANFDIGLVYEGAPGVALNLAGNACVAQGVGCQSVSSFPGLQSNLQAEQAKLAHDVRILKFYPVVSMGFGWRF